MARPWDSSAIILAPGTSLHYFPDQIGGLRGPVKKTMGRWLNNSQLEVVMPSPLILDRTLLDREEIGRKGGKEGGIERERERRKKGRER